MFLGLDLINFHLPGLFHVMAFAKGCLVADYKIHPDEGFWIFVWLQKLGVFRGGWKKKENNCELEGFSVF